MSEYEGVDYWQTDTMIDVYGEDLTVEGGHGTYDLSDCQLDIGLVKQNGEKDLLLNSAHEKVILKEGEIGIPALLKDMYGITIGDRVLLNCGGTAKEFIVKEYVLDSMMNSTMASSTRILLSDRDFDSLLGKAGENEYLIEAYLTDKTEASALQTAYENAGLPQYGRAVNYSIIFLLSALTDITSVFVMLLVSALLIIVSFICIRFTIVAALEEEVREIGTMKAVGLPYSDIRDIYLYKYRALAVAAVVLGYIFALLLSGSVTKHISSAFGGAGISAPSAAISLAAGFLVFLLINSHCKRVLKKIKKITVVDALVFGKGFGADRGGIKDGLYKAKRLSVNCLMGIREVFYKFRSWTIVFAVALIAVMLIMIPVNLLNTFRAPEFITYMGSSLEDILIEVENGKDLETGYSNVKQLLQKDSDVENYYEYRSVRAKTPDAENKLMNLSIDCGSNAGNELKYLSGNSPEGENELALSCLYADEIGKAAGDKIELLLNDAKKEFAISGVYQDVTGGGYSAKSKYDFSELTAVKYSFSVNVGDSVPAEIKAGEWSKILGAGVTVDPMKEFIDQTLGGVADQLSLVVLAAAAIGAALAVLIAVLFLKLRLAKDMQETAIMKAMGFSERDIKKQYLIKMGLVCAAGVLSGIVCTELLGEKIVNAALGLAGLGIKEVALVADPVAQYIMCPLLLPALMLLSTWIVTKAVRKYSIVSIINE
jgi:putative ABC transport system permease protein